MCLFNKHKNFLGVKALNWMDPLQMFHNNKNNYKPGESPREKLAQQRINQQLNTPTTPGIDGAQLAPKVQTGADIANRKRKPTNLFQYDLTIPVGSAVNTGDDNQTGSGVTR